MSKVQSFIVSVIVLVHFVNSLSIPGAQYDETDDETNVDNVIVGDMEFSPKQYQFLFSNDSVKRHGLKRQFNHWSRGVVPVKLDPELNDNFKAVIKEAMDYIMSVSCIKFVLDFDEDNFRDFVMIRKANGCSSPVGCLRRGVQYVKLQPDACKLGNIIHELLHTLGFLHMHTARDRDSFVRINYNNIMPQARKNFEKYVTYVSMYDTQYDYRSIMHYSKKAFAVDDKKMTITPFERVKAMGQRSVMTDGDITRLNRMYRCPDFLAEDDFIESDDEMFDNSEVIEYTPLEDEGKNGRSDDENDDEQNDALTEDEINFVNDDSSQLADEDTHSPASLAKQLKNATSELVSAIKPLCNLQKKLKTILTYIDQL